MRLYDYAPSQNCFKVRLLAAHLGLRLEIVQVSIFAGEGTTPAFLAKNPMGGVPVLETDAGDCLAESNAILAFLAEGTRYLPREGIARAQVLRWLMFEQRFVQTSISRLRYWTLTDKLDRFASEVATPARWETAFSMYSTANSPSALSLPAKFTPSPTSRFSPTAMSPPMRISTFPRARTLLDGLTASGASRVLPAQSFPIRPTPIRPGCCRLPCDRQRLPCPLVLVAAAVEQFGRQDAMSTIAGYHAHVYFNAAERERAQRLCEAARAAFGVVVGRMHDGPVGPHPRGSCQLSVGNDQFASVLPWLIVNRNGLTIFAHAQTGDALKDHTEHVIWLGPSEPLDLSALSRAR